MTALLNRIIADTGFEDEVQALKALHQLATDWEDIRTRFTSIDGIDDIESLLGAIAARNQAIQQELATLSIPASQFEALSGLLGRLQGRLDHIDPSIKKLLQPTGDFEETDSSNPGLAELPLLSVEKVAEGRQSLSGRELDFNLTASASTTLAAEAGDLLPFADAQRPGRHLRISTLGVVTAGAGATLPFTGGRFQAGVRGEAGAELSYFFAADHQSLFAFELARSLPRLPPPFSYAAVVKAMREHRLDAVSFKVQGVTSGKVSLAISQAAQLFNPAVPVDVSLQFSVSAKRSGVFDVALGAQRDAAGNLNAARMVLSRNSSRERATSFGVTVTVDSTELFEVLRKHVEGMLGEYRALVGEYEEYLTPGTWLKNRLGEWASETLEELVGDPNVRDAIGMALGNPNATRRFQDLVANTLEDAANSVTGFYDQQTSRVIKAVRDRVTESLPPVLVKALGPKLDTLIEKGVGRLREGLQEQVNQVVERVSEEADQQIETLSELTGPVRDAIDRGADKADQLFKGVRQVLAEIEKNLQKLHDAATELARAKLTIAWSETTTTTEGQVIEFDASLPVDGDLNAFDDVYDGLMRGSMGKVASLLDRPGIKVHSQTIEAYATWKQASVYSVVFMDTLLEHSSILSADCRIRLEGESIAVGTQAALEEWSRDKHQQQTATFLNVVDLAVARSQPSQVVRKFQLRLGLKHEEDRFREVEVRNFLGEFEAIGAIRIGATDRAVAAMEEAGMIDPSGVLRTSVGLVMSMDEAGFGRLLDLGANLSRGPWPPNRIRSRVFRTSLPITIATGTFDRRYKGSRKAEKRRQYAHEVLQVLADSVDHEVATLADSATLMANYRSLASKKVRKPMTSSGEAKRKSGEWVVDLNESLCEALFSLREIWISNPVRSREDERWYRDRQSEIARALDKWMNTGFALVGGWKDGKPRHETVAFCALIGQLAGNSGQPLRMGVTIQAPGREETIIIQ